VTEEATGQIHAQFSGTGASALKKSGPREYAVCLVAAGLNKNGFVIAPEALAEAAPLFEGVTSFVDHVDFWSGAHPSVRDVCGVIAGPYIDEATGDLCGELRLAGYDWLAAVLDGVVRERDAGRPAPNVGMSADLLFEVDSGGAAGEKHVRRILKVYSVDVVFDPAAGGEILRVLHSSSSNLSAKLVSAGEGAMEENVTGAVAPVSAPEATQSAQAEETRAAVVQQEIAEAGAQAPASRTQFEAGHEALRAQANELLRMQCGAVLTGVLSQSDLPEPFKHAVRERFSGRVFEAGELAAEMERQRTIWAALQERQVVSGITAPGERRGLVAGMWTDLDRLQLATERLFGLELPEAARDTPRLSGIRELYLLATGDHEFVGMFQGERVQFANATTTTMAGLVKNAMNKVIPLEWARLGRAGYDWYKKIVLEADFESLQQITWITVGGFGDLPTVAEGAAYTELV
jgi:hypothetical protein